MIKLIQGDCLEKMKDIESGSVDLILTDPPYGTTACKWDSIIDLDLMWEQLKRIIKPVGAVLLFGQNPFSSALIMSNPKIYRYDWIWEKTEAKGHLNAKKMPMRAHENISVFYNKLPTFNPQKTIGHKLKEAKNVDRAEKQSKLYGEQKSITSYSSTERYPRSVQLFSSDKQKENYHPTQKPVDLLKYLIKTYTNENETVLDFTMGSVTTGVAACNLNRKFIGIEKDSDYFEIAKKRIEAADSQLNF